MAVDAWSGAIGAVGAASVASVIGMFLKIREIRGTQKAKEAENAAKKEREDSTSLGEAAKTLETAFDKSQERNEKWVEKYEKILERVAALDTRVALQDQKIAAQDEKITLLNVQLNGKTDELDICRGENRDLRAKLAKAEYDADTYRFGMESFVTMLEAANGIRTDEGLLVIARERMETAKRQVKEKRVAGPEKENDGHTDPDAGG